MEKEVQTKKKKLKKLLKDVPPARLKLLEPTIENVAWMEVKLDDTRQQIKNAPVAIKYDNGGGQKGVRKNPLFDGYHQLWKSYQSGLAVLLEELPEEAAHEIKETGPPTVLELVKQKKAV